VLKRERTEAARIIKRACKTRTRGGQRRKVKKREAEEMRMTYGRPELEEWGVTERGMRDLVKHLMSC